MRIRIHAVFDGTDTAELAAIAVGETGVAILERTQQHLFVSDETARFGVTNGVDLPMGSFKTLFAPEGRFAPQPLDAGGSVLLTIVVAEHEADEAKRALINRGARKLHTTRA